MSNPRNDSVVAPIEFFSINEAKRLSQKFIPRVAWDWLEGGVGAEQTIARNEQVFGSIGLVPRLLRDVSDLRFRRSVFGFENEIPVIGSPLGGLTQYHVDGEAELVSGFSGLGILPSVSAMSRLHLDEILSVSPSCRMIYQMYLNGSEEWLLDQAHSLAKTPNLVAICICADVPERPFRTRDRENRYDARRYGRGEPIRPEGVSVSLKATWDLFAKIRNAVDTPLIVKGVLSAVDAEIAFDSGADAVWVSNHGGRSTDFGVSPIDVLPRIRDKVGQDKFLIADGGVRSAIDVFKLLRFGADVAGVGRPLVYGLSLSGAVGVSRILSLLAEEFKVSARNLGVRDINDIRGLEVVPKFNH